MDVKESNARLVTLGTDDIDRLHEFERQCFDPTIQADRETILNRLSIGHMIYGLDEDGFLAAAVAFSYAKFSPQNRIGFPLNEYEFSMQAVPTDYNAVFIYSRGVHPLRQRRGYSKILVDAVFRQSKTDGCTYAVGNPRTASYAGSDPDSAHETIPQNPKFRQAVDRYLAGGNYPSKDELLADPNLVYHSHLPGCVFHWIIPGFAPSDTASGGIRIIVYLPLANWHSSNF